MQRQRAARRLGHWSNDPPAGPFMARSGARPHINVILRIRVNIGFPPALRYVVAAFWGKNQANRIRRPTIMGNTSSVRIASAMLAIAIASTAAPAQAQTLFDMLFKKKQRERVVVAPAPQPASTAARQPVKKVTVAPARYYSYHASKPVTFAAKEITPAAAAGAGGPGMMPPMMPMGMAGAAAGADADRRLYPERRLRVESPANAEPVKGRREARKARSTKSSEDTGEGSQ